MIGDAKKPAPRPEQVAQVQINGTDWETIRGLPNPVDGEHTVAIMVDGHLVFAGRLHTAAGSASFEGGACSIVAVRAAEGAEATTPPPPAATSAN